ncbi:hypothetical protein CVS40_11706 [Lucilia cuprina]|nr:hypothetical protein CVS40_11706 [Lucilia cuprina]
MKYHRCNWEEIQGEFHRVLKGDAKDWYWLVVQNKSLDSWEEMKRALRVQYSSNRSEYERMRDFEERRQKAGESIDEYFQTMRKLRARLRVALPEYEAIRIIKRNLRINISQIVYPLQVYSVEHLRDECKEIEKNYLKHENPSIQQPRQNFTRRRVEEIVGDQEEAIDEIFTNKKENLNAQNNNSTLICWNCHIPGHTFMDCTSIQRILFCYKCGLPGAITPNCPKCSKNRVWSGKKTAESRSTQTTAENQKT